MIIQLAFKTYVSYQKQLQILQKQLFK